MPYLKLIQDKIQELANDLFSRLNVDVTVVDQYLVRIVGTGDYYNRINENGPKSSLFSRILNSGKPEFNICKVDNIVCMRCSAYKQCKEICSMAYPITLKGESIGVIGFIAFKDEQKELMISKENEYFYILSQAAEKIQREIDSIRISNELNYEITEVDEIINSINKGIIILNSSKQITHVNAKSLKILGINLKCEKVLRNPVDKVIKNIVNKGTSNKETIAEWEINGQKIKVLYKIDDIVLKDQKISTLISFDEVKEILNKALNVRDASKTNFENIIGKSEKLSQVIEKAKIAAKTSLSVFIHGESGTGKELFARSIHNSSNRKDNPFIAINCSSIPENLFESELFGYEKGAFTGASLNGKIGKFELADKGTLFLDEIGDFPMHLQPKLLRVLQQKEITRVGGNKSIKIDVRIISATHKDLLKLVEEKRFREDLYYRLNVIPLNIPSLCERGDDILLCSDYIIYDICSKMGIKPKKLSKEVEKKFLEYKWPGNIRELQNVLEYAVVFSKNNLIEAYDMPDYFLPDRKSNKFYDDGKFPDVSLEKMTNQFQKNIINRYIEKYGSDIEGKKRAAKELGISVTTLYRRLSE